MMQTCRKCGVLFKTENPQRRNCYDCEPIASAKRNLIAQKIVA